MWKNRLILAAAVVAALVFVYFDGGTIPYLLASLVVVAPALSLLHLLLCAPMLRQAPGARDVWARKGEPAQFEFRLKNRGILPIPLVLARFSYDGRAFEGAGAQDVFSLGPRAAYDCQVCARCKLAGTFPCGLRSLEARDFLGVFRVRRKTEGLFEIRVLPRLLPLDRLPAAGDVGFDAAAARRRETVDPLTVSDIRAYTEGDSFRDIHWNLSAKKGSLLVKTHDPVAGMPALLAVDFSPAPAGIDPWIYRDRLLEYAASLAGACLQAGLTLRATFFDTGVFREERLASTEQLRAFCRRLPAVPLTAKLGAGALVDAAVREASPARHLLLVSGPLDAAAEDALQLSRQLGYAVYRYDATRPLNEPNGHFAARRPA